MPTFVEICQMARQECGMGGSGPSSTVGQTGALGTIVQRTSQAWIDIQKSKPYWKFLRANLTFTLVVDQALYVVSDPLPSGFALTAVDKWDKESCWIYTATAADRSRLTYVPYQVFRNAFSTYVSGRPTHFTEGANGTVLFNRKPDAAYVIDMDYWMTPERLVNPTDIPALPEQFHDLIAWKSVMKFAGAEMATDLYAYAKSEYTPMYLQLMIDQIDVPAKVRSYALAGGNGRPIAFGDR